MVFIIPIIGTELYMKNNLLYKSFKFTFKISPIAHIVVIIEEIWQALFHSGAALLIGKLIDTVIHFTQSGSNSAAIIKYGILFAGMYLMNELWALVYNGAVNIGIYEKPNNYANLLLAQKASRLNLIDFENSNILNMYKYAKENIKNEYLSVSSMKAVYIFCRLIEMSSLTLVLAFFDYRLCFIALFSVFPYFIIRLIRGKEMYKYKTIKIPEERRLDYLWSLFTDKRAAKELRLTGADNYVKDKWLTKNKEIFDGVFKLRKKDSVSVLFCDMLSSIGYAVSIFLCISLAVNKKNSAGSLGASIGAFTALQFCMMCFLEAVGTIPSLTAYTKHFFEFMNLPENYAVTTRGENIIKLNNYIEVNNISFSYPNSEKNAVESVSFTINKGEKVILVGKNGSGKTTLLKLILGLYEVKDGEVLWDKKNISKINKEQLYKDVSIVMQQPVQYNFSLRENIAISDLKELKNDKKIISVLKETDSDYILEKTEGLDGLLGRSFGGAELSGGQWQRISLARCIFKDASFLVLDEPTASLDPIEETHVLKTFLNLVKNKTAIIISHRVGLCKYVDKIIVMKEGSIAGVGTHNELLGSCEEYKSLYLSQAELY